MMPTNKLPVIINDSDMYPLAYVKANTIDIPKEVNQTIG